MPECLIGDFSKLVFPNEEKVGGVLPSSKYQRLIGFLSVIDAKSIQVNANLFIWKKRIHIHLIYERLDR